MAKIAKTALNHWKKSVVATVAFSYGIDYAYDKYKLEQLMRLYCEEAARYGDVPVPPTLKPRNIAVILNPAANRRKAKSNFEKYSAPLFHLAGYTVSVFQTESEGHARSLVANLKDADLIVVAGGDGTLSETVTGLMRIHGKVEHPLGVLPLGRTNSTSLALLGLEKEGEAKPAAIAAATMAVVRGQTKAVDAIKVEVIEGEQESLKPVYSLSGIRWGVYHDTLSRQDRYWYLGVLRGYAAVLFNSLGMQEPVVAHVTYTHACSGCNHCYKSRADLQPPSQNTRWYFYLLPSFTKKQPETEAPLLDYRNIVNSQCGTASELDLSCVDVNISTPCICPGGTGICVSLGPPSLSWSEFLSEGWRRVRGETPTSSQHIEAQQMEIIPVTNLKEKEEKWFSVDNEEYEVRPIKITFLPKLVKVFSLKQDQTSYTLLERALLGC